MSWPSSMQRRYGFTREQALGRNSHQLLGTVFPLTLQDIEATLIAEQHWRGGLIHYHADGRPLIVMEDWDLNERSSGAEPTVTEAHSDAMNAPLADLLAILANQLSQPLTAIGNYVNGACRALGRDEPDTARLRMAMTLASAQIVRSAQQLQMLRSLADDLRHSR